jgi:hypothetical protein
MYAVLTRDHSMEHGRACNAHSVGCPVCGAKAWDNCRYPDGTDVGDEISHSSRFVAALHNPQTSASDGLDDEGAFLGGWVS